LKQALKDEDCDTLSSTLNMARAAVVQELATISTESAASINPAVVKLQMLDCLADGFELQAQATFQQPGVHQDFPDVVSSPGECPAVHSAAMVMLAISERDWRGQNADNLDCSQIRLVLWSQD